MEKYLKTTILSAALVAGALFIGAGTAVAAEGGNAEEGQFVFGDNCEICHSAEEGGAHKIGPNLFGVIGKTSGTTAGYTYSPAMAAAGVSWDSETLGTFLQGPAAMIPGTKMGFPGFAVPEDEANLVAYLNTLQ